MYKLCLGKPEIFIRQKKTQTNHHINLNTNMWEGAKALPNHPLDPVPIDCPGNKSFAHGYTKTGTPCEVVLGMYCKPASCLRPVFKDGRKTLLAAYSASSRKKSALSRFRRPILHGLWLVWPLSQHVRPWFSCEPESHGCVCV